MTRRDRDHEDSPAGAPTQADTLSPRDVAKELGVTARTVRGWIASGLLDAERIGPKLWRIRRADLDAFRRRGR